MDNDPYRYFRIEAQELVQELSRGVLDLEKPDGAEQVGHLLRQAHTLKGAARVVKQTGIGDLAHAIEDVLSPHRNATGSIDHGRIVELLGFLDRIAAQLAMLEVSRSPSDSPAPASGGAVAETVRVELDEMNLLLEGLLSTSSELASVARRARDVDGIHVVASRLLAEGGGGRPHGQGAWSARANVLCSELVDALAALRTDMQVGIERTGASLGEVHERAVQLRLVPAVTSFPSIERAVREAAESLGKAVDFQATGGEHRVDAHVLTGLRDALLHVVRNAVAHGIEPPSDRVAVGKPRAGRIEVHVVRRGGRITVTCRDDGRGIDVEAVGNAARLRGLLPARPERLSTEEAVRLILEGGLTTSPELTKVAGRGIGLDVVRATVTALKGAVSVRTEPGRGTTLEMAVPASLSAIPAVLVEADGATFGVPLDAVPTTLRIADGDIVRGAEGDSILHEGSAIPLFWLGHLVASEAARAPAARSGISASVAVVQSGARRAAMGVERIIGTASLVMRSLAPWVDADPYVAGTALDRDGRASIILDPLGLLEAADGGRGREVSRVSKPRPVLVVDDSLTTRMLEESILESAGYEVDVAVSGEEALGLALRREYGVLVVDVEMPGMDGFELIERMQGDPRLRDVPAILVTSRSSEEDRRRGEAAGARAYIVKSEFDQVRLLAIIRELTP